MHRSQAFLVLAALGFTILGARAAPPPQSVPAAAPRSVSIDLDKAVAITLPALRDELQAVRFHTADGREGWALRIPGNRPIATPAFADGRLYVGGGYGSHEFYAFDAATGKVAWQVKTSDDGPTAAVVEDGCVAFNTESCTVMVLDAGAGRTLWQEWLGDPLMSQPAISRGRLYMAYPGNDRGPKVNVQIAPGVHEDGLRPRREREDEAGWTHRLLCAELRTGRHLWVRAIPAEVITAPVIEGEKLYLSCFDGSSLCVDASSGRLEWIRHNGATSAPMVAQGEMVMTEKRMRGGRTEEGLRRFDAEKGAERDTTLLAAGKAEYLNSRAAKNASGMLESKALADLDQSVGFATPPASAGLGKAADHLNVSTVVGGWAYQGSKAAYRGGQILNAQGGQLNAVRAKDGKVAWQAQARGREVAADAQLFAPPALGRKNLYLCTARGHLIAVSQKDGRAVFAYSTGQPMAFQPALANGAMYAGTSNGMLICLQSGDPDADGWSAWGGNAQHNKGE